MKQVLLFFIGLLLLATMKNANAQTTISPFPFISDQLCAGSQVDVPYNITGTFNSGNIFTAQLSDAFGNFTTFSNIGSITATQDSSIRCTIPTNIAGSTTYRIRIVSTNPPMVGPDNIIDLTYYVKPFAEFDLGGLHNRFLVNDFITPNNTSINQFFCDWNFGSGALPPTSNSCAPGFYAYGTTGPKTVTLEITSAQGCRDTAVKQIEVLDCNPAIQGNALVVNNTMNVNSGSYTSSWICSGGILNLSGGWDQVIYVESGGTLNLLHGASGFHTVYMKAGSVVICDIGGHNLTFVREPGSSITFTHPQANHIVHNCGSLTFNYCAAPLNGCFVTAPAATIAPNGPVSFCIGDSVRLDANTGASYLWSTGSTDQSIMVHTSGTYFVDVTYVNGCTRRSHDTIVNVRAQPTAIITHSPSLFICTGDSVILTSSSASSYLWSNGSTDQTISVLSTDTYEVEITDIFGCMDTSAVVQVDVNPIPVITPSSSVQFCFGDSVELVADAGSAYLWSNGMTTQSIWIYGTDTLTVTVTDTLICSNPSLPMYVTETPSAAAVQASGRLHFCFGDSVTLTASGAGASFLWSNTQTSQSVVLRTTGTYHVALTDTFGCFYESDTFDVRELALTDATITANGNFNFCFDPGQRLVLSAPSQMVSYLWTYGVTSQTMNALNTGRYDLTVIDTNNCTNSSFVNVQVNPIPVVSVGNTFNSFCEGDSLLLVAHGGTSYIWSASPSTSNTIYVKSTDTYSVRAVGPGGCTSLPVSVQVNEVPLPIPVLTFGGNDTICTGQKVTLYASGGTNYLWNNFTTADSIVINNNRPEIFFTAFNGPNNLCGVRSDTVKVTMLPLPAVWYPAISPYNKCKGDTATFTVQAQAGIQYQWYLDTTAIIGANSNVYSGTGVGDLYFIATDSFGCKNTSVISKVIDDMPEKPVVGVVADIFLGTTSPTYNYQYRWTVNDSLLNAQVFMQANIKPPVNGNYRVLVYSRNGCSVASDPFNFTWVSNETELFLPEWKVYPNPAQNYIIVESPVESASATIIDMQGRILTAQHVGFGNNQLELGHLSSGIYHLLIKSGEYTGNYKIQVVH
jgi:hypothetical protein